MIEFTLNGEKVQLDVEPDMPLLWVIRDELGLSGTKFGCGVAQCGACTVHLEGDPIRSCVTPVHSIAGKRLATIEGLNDPLARRLRDAWIKVDVPQCGYCQSGQLMSAHALLHNNPKPTDQDIVSAMDGNLCRCGTYQRIKKAIREVAAEGTDHG